MASNLAGTGRAAGDGRRAAGDGQRAAARAAREAGKAPEEIRAIMESAKPIADGLAPARKQFSDAVVALLTPAQIAAVCGPPPAPVMD